MAREVLGKIYFVEMERSGCDGRDVMPGYGENCSVDVFDAIKQKIVRVSEGYKSILQGLPIPFRRKSSKGSPEEEQSSQRLLTQEQIEMAHLGQAGFVDPDLPVWFRGHLFVPHHLSSPSWCDKCGDFIWGLDKQCVKCNHCQFTCHHRCYPSISLDCKSVSQEYLDEIDSAETSLTEPPDTLTSDLGSEAANEKDETDSGYRSGTIPEEKLPRKPSQATLNREDLRKRIEEYNSLVPGIDFSLKEERGETFQGFIRVTLNLVRPISMSLGARPPSIYEILTKEHIVDESTEAVSFYMPRDTKKSIHVCSDLTAKEVITSLLKKFRILDNPRKFAMYEQELHNGKIVKLRRIADKESPLAVTLNWETELIHRFRLVLQENETGEIVWEAFSKPELGNFLRVLEKEEEEYVQQLKYKYKVMKRIIQQRLKELRKERRKTATELEANSPASPKKS